MKKLLGICLFCGVLILAVQLVSNQVIQISGTAYAWEDYGKNCAACHGVIKANPKSLKFDPTKLGTSSTKEIIITNKGNKEEGGPTLDLWIDTDNITFTGASFNEYSQINDCTDPIPYLSTCTITVTSTPTGYGKRVAGLAISSNDLKTSEIILQLSVDAKSPKIKTKPSTVSLSTTPGGTATKTLVITNNGLSDLIISNTFTPTGTDAGDFLVQPVFCTPIPQGQSCSLEITYNPTVTKISTAQIVIDSNDQVKSSVTVKLKGKSK